MKLSAFVGERVDCSNFQFRVTGRHTYRQSGGPAQCFQTSHQAYTFMWTRECRTDAYWLTGMVMHWSGRKTHTYGRKWLWVGHPEHETNMEGLVIPVPMAFGIGKQAPSHPYSSPALMMNYLVIFQFNTTSTKSKEIFQKSTSHIISGTARGGWGYALQARHLSAQSGEARSGRKISKELVLGPFRRSQSQ